MSEDRFILTQAGYDKLQRELNYLLHHKSAELAEEMSEVHDDTEAGEEATFFDVMSAKEQLETRISHIRRVLQRAEIIGEDPDLSRVDPGDRVTVWDFTDETELNFDLIGTEEVAIGLAGVSILSPVGKALLGKQVGDVVEVEVPDGKVRYAVRKIQPLRDLIP